MVGENKNMWNAAPVGAEQSRSTYVKQALASAAAAGAEVEIAIFDEPRISHDYQGSMAEFMKNITDYERGLAGLDPPREVVDRVHITQRIADHLPYSGLLLIYSMPSKNS